MPDCDENMALTLCYAKKSRHKHNRWRYQSSP